MVLSTRYTLLVRIALISGSAGDHRCGVGDYTYCLAQFLAVESEVDLYYARDHAPVEPPYHRLKNLQLKPVSGFSVVSMPGFASSLSRQGYDIIHLQYPSRGFGKSIGPGVLFQRLNGMQSRSRLVVTLHEWTTSHTLRKALMEQILTATDALMVTNEAELNTLVKKFARKVTAVPVGNVSRVQAQMDAVWLSFEGKPVPGLPEISGPTGRQPLSLFHYGLPAHGKGFERMLQALSIVRKTGIDAKLHIYGDLPTGDRLSEEILAWITEYDLADSAIRHGHIRQEQLEQTALQYRLGIFPFDEGFSSKRSSVASISHLELPLVVGGGSIEDHPYYAPNENTGKSLAVLLIDLFKGRLEDEWTAQVERQREYASRFSFPKIASYHLDFYKKLRHEST